MMEKKRLSIAKRIIIAALSILALALIAFGMVYFAVRERGRKSLSQHLPSNTNSEMMLYDGKTVEYNGKSYRYNDKLINILFLGVDLKDKTVSQMRQENRKFDGGQADALFLVTIDTDMKTVSAISINRQSVTNIDQYDKNGEYIGTVESQICTRHGYGDGLELSCERTVDSISRMLYNIPINGYASLYLPGIRTLNGLVGGVEVQVLDNIPPKGYYESDFGDYGIGDSLLNAKGKNVTLDDNQAYAYIRYRNLDVDGSSDGRLNRQRQYLKALLKKFIDKTKKNILFPLDILETMKEYMVMNLDTDELIYLVSTAISYKIDLDNMTYLPGKGEPVVIEGRTYENYILDEPKLKELVFSRFYKVVE